MKVKTELLLMLAVAVLSTSCGAKVDVEQPSFCLSWPDGGAPETTAPPANLACENIPGAGALGDAKLPVVYVCIEPDQNGCPSPSAAHAKFGSCIEERTGPACQKSPDGTFMQGSCVERITVSACGPDPAAVGACCYYANMVELTFES